ncbi:MAG: primosomal protein N', partial [[Clostridium] leptum]
METARVGKVAVENTAYHFDKAYDYLIPQTLWAKAEKGCRVLVPFGGGNRTRQGLLMDVEEIRAGRTGSEEGLKSVKAVLDQTPLLSPEMLLLARWMKERYFCTLFDAVRVMLPAGLHYQVACSYQAARDIPPEKLEVLGEEEKRLIAYLSRCRLPVRRDKLLAALGYEADVDLPE